MLKFIRDNARGVVAWIIVIIIIIPFALWGVNEYLETGGDVVVARIGDQEIMLGQFQNAYHRELAASERTGGDESLRRQVLNRMINGELISSAALEAGFRIPDALVGSYIQSMSDFQTEGRFDRELYGRLLASAGLSPAQFEADTRRNLLIDQLVGGVSETAFVTSAEVDVLFSLLEQQRRLGYGQLPASRYETLARVDEADVERHYREHRERYAVAEQVVAQYLELSLDAIKRTIEVDEETLTRLYAERRAEFGTPEERRAHHVLVAVPRGADTTEEDEARGRALELLSAIRAGESFEEVARTHSEDRGSARSGGDLGFLARGDMAEAFENVVFAMEPGDVEGPVRTPFGFHLIRLDEIRPGATRSFEEVREALADEYRSTRAEELFFDLSDRLADLAFEYSDTLEVAAGDLHLEIRSVGPFSEADGSGVAVEAAFREAAFSPDVLEGGHNSPLIDLGSSRAVVLRVADREPAHHLPLDEVRDRIEARLHDEQVARLAEAEGESFIERARDGEDPEALALEYGAEWNAVREVDRDDLGLDAAVLDAAFAMPRPSADHPVRFGGISLPDGSYAVIALHEVIDGDPSVVAEGDRTGGRDAMRDLRGQMAVEGLVETLRQKAQVRIYEDRL